jgi:hypothetical protein
VTAPRRRHRPPTARPALAVPPAPLHEPGGNRTPIGPDTLRAGFAAHVGDAHAGTPRTDAAQHFPCPTCLGYQAAINQARITHGDPAAFEAPPSAVNAYAALIRPTIGGPA